MSSMPHNPFFKMEDLQTLELTITGINSTSQVKFPQGSLHLLQILPDGIWIEVPPKYCAHGHALTLDIVGKKQNGKVKKLLANGEAVEEDSYLENQMHLMGVIEEIEGNPKEKHQVRVKFRQYSQSDWERLILYFLEKQVSINQLIKSTRK